jgi:DNA-binding CsgD family transcriptional regulator
MKRYETGSPFPLMLYRSYYGVSRKEEDGVKLEIEKELAVLKEWGQVQKNLLDCIFMPSPAAIDSWRSRIEEGVCQSTHGYAQIWWEPLPSECTLGSGQLVEICYERTRYGMLKLAPGYLVSHLVPDLHQAFGHLCALLISLTEHQALVRSLLKPLKPLEAYNELTSREKEVLQGMAAGESENTTAQRLNIALTTVRTHRHNVYRCLEVHSPQEAVLRSFALRIVDWMDLSCTVRPVAVSTSSKQKNDSKDERGKNRIQASILKEYR